LLPKRTDLAAVPAFRFCNQERDQRFSSTGWDLYRTVFGRFEGPILLKKVLLCWAQRRPEPLNFIDCDPFLSAPRSKR
jgi:hypothetical protein